ncbi:hypothetical protein [Streptomyces hygroscopicus]|uniref:hypothetical protein n=1 Tax=Streptomyces hygroscopicus TaxID=1912 RepID=UPI00223EBA3D|nr:hypothetical protein [Streptomyces hygroscopicus]
MYTSKSRLFVGRPGGDQVGHSLFLGREPGQAGGRAAGVHVACLQLPVTPLRIRLDAEGEVGVARVGQDGVRLAALSGAAQDLAVGENDPGVVARERKGYEVGEGLVGLPAHGAEVAVRR